MDLFQSFTFEELASRIDQTILDIDTDIVNKKLEKSLKYPFRCILTWSSNAPLVRSKWKKRVCSVANFPHGSSPLKSIEYELIDIWEKGVDEVDIALSPLLLRSNHKRYEEYAKHVVALARDIGFSVVKLIVEIPLLSVEEIEFVTKVVEESRADYLKTSTGIMSKSKLRDVYLVKTINPMINVKASGGIRGALEALSYINLGASIIGSSSGVEILEEFAFLRRFTKSREGEIS